MGVHRDLGTQEGVWDTLQAPSLVRGAWGGSIFGAIGGSSNKSGSEGNFFSIISILEMRKGEKRNGKWREKKRK